MCQKCHDNPEFRAISEFSAAMYALAKNDMLATEPGMAVFAWIADDHGTTVAAMSIVATAVRIRAPHDGGPDEPPAEIHVQEVAPEWEAVTDNIPAHILGLTIPFVNFALAEDTDGVNSIWNQIARTGDDFAAHIAAICTLLDLLYTGLNTPTRKARK